MAEPNPPILQYATPMTSERISIQHAGRNVTVRMRSVPLVEGIIKTTFALLFALIFLFIVFVAFGVAIENLKNGNEIVEIMVTAAFGLIFVAVVVFLILWAVENIQGMRIRTELSIGDGFLTLTAPTTLRSTVLHWPVESVREIRAVILSNIVLSVDRKGALEIVADPPHKITFDYSYNLDELISIARVLTECLEAARKPEAAAGDASA